MYLMVLNANALKSLFTTFTCKIKNIQISSNTFKRNTVIASTKLQFRGSLPLRVYLIKDRFFCYLYLITLIDNISIIPTLCYSASP